MPEPRSNPEVVDRLLGPDPDRAFPNHPKWPLLVYRSVVSPEEADPGARHGPHRTW